MTAEGRLRDRRLDRSPRSLPPVGEKPHDPDPDGIAEGVEDAHEIRLAGSRPPDGGRRGCPGLGRPTVSMFVEHRTNVALAYPGPSGARNVRRRHRRLRDRRISPEIAAAPSVSVGVAGRLVTVFVAAHAVGAPLVNAATAHLPRSRGRARPRGSSRTRPRDRDRRPHGRRRRRRSGRRPRRRRRRPAGDLPRRDRRRSDRADRARPRAPASAAGPRARWRLASRAWRSPSRHRAHWPPPRVPGPRRSGSPPPPSGCRHWQAGHRRPRGAPAHRPRAARPDGGPRPQRVGPRCGDGGRRPPRRRGPRTGLARAHREASPGPASSRSPRARAPAPGTDGRR